jgi:hypothetical protein
MSDTGASAGGLPAAWRGQRGRRARTALSEVVADRTLGAPELGIVSLLLLVLGAVVLGHYVLHGGFYTDDWVQASETRYPAHGGLIGHLRAFDVTWYRPGQYLYYPAIHTLLGLHMKAYLAWAALCAVAMSVALYALLRVQGLPVLESFATAALVLVFPYSSSTRLWSSTCVTSIAITLYLVGTIVVLRSLAGRSRRPLLVHALGVAIVLCGVMTYEVVAPAALLSIVFYVRATPDRRRAVKAWIVDLVLVGGILAFVTSGRQQQVHSFGDEVSHGWLIFRQSLDLWPAIVAPYGAVPVRIAVGALIVVALAALVVARLLPRSDPARRDLLVWLGVLGAGVVAIAVGYAMFLPADDYYSPATLGIGDRTNGFAAVGWSLTVVALVRLAVTLVFRDVRRGRVVLAAGLALAVGAVGVGYAQRLRDEANVYVASFTAQQQILATMHATIPDPPHDSTIFLVRHTPWAGPGVPVYAQWWDMYGAVRLTYHDPSLWGYPIVPPVSSLACGATAVQSSPAPYGAPAPYGLAYVLDMSSGIATRITSRAVCRQPVAAVGVATPVAG